MSRKRFLIVMCVALLAGNTLHAEESNFAMFFFRVGNWIDNISLKDIDTTYIGLPEFAWRVASNNSTMGIHSALDVNSEVSSSNELVSIVSTTTPSVDLGFHVALRSLGFGYSWDALNNYAQKYNITLGGKSWGVDFIRQKSGNFRTTVAFPGYNVPPEYYSSHDALITNTNLSVWYALNSRHYSHNAAVKQAYIQKRTAGSLLLSLTYMNTDISFGHDSAMSNILSYMTDVQKMVTHQVAVGLGYGINYTPNNGKVLIHASATAQLVFYSINYIAYNVPDSLRGFAYPSYAIRPTTPVHLTGTMRAAVSYEINKWVHLHARAQVNNMRFKSVTDVGMVSLSNWTWQAHLAVAVRLGVSKERKNRALGIVPMPRSELVPVEPHAAEGKRFTLPLWLTDYFFSPTH